MEFNLSPLPKVLNTDPFFIIGITALSTIVVELLSWLLVYRTSTYKRTVSDIL